MFSNKCFNKKLLLVVIVLILFFCLGCKKGDSKKLQMIKLKSVLEQCCMFDDLKQNILQNSDSFFSDFQKVLVDNTKDLLIFVDKKHLLNSTFTPLDLVPVENSKYMKTNRAGHSLRKPVYDALCLMCKAANDDGLTMLVSSTFRSYKYQDGLYNRYVSVYGQEEADTFSAKPGSSQHQLGVAIDFGDVEDTFALTEESKWLEVNAKKYGFSLSFPKDFDEITGFKWECWHYRYIGVSAVNCQEKWFGNIQHFLIEFVYYWNNYKEV